MMILFKDNNSWQVCISYDKITSVTQTQDGGSKINLCDGTSLRVEVDMFEHLGKLDTHNSLYCKIDTGWSWIK